MRCEFREPCGVLSLNLRHVGEPVGPSLEVIAEAKTRANGGDDGGESHLSQKLRTPGWQKPDLKQPQVS